MEQVNRSSHGAFRRTDVLEVAGCVNEGRGGVYGMEACLLIHVRVRMILVRVSGSCCGFLRGNGKAAPRKDGLISAGMWAEERARRDGSCASLTAGAAGGGSDAGQDPGQHSRARRTRVKQKGGGLTNPASA